MTGRYRQPERTPANILVPGQKLLFREHYNQTCFMFEHALQWPDLFELANVVELSERHPDSSYSTHDDPLDDDVQRARKPKTLAQTIATMADTDSLVIVKGLADDPEFGPVFADLLAEFEDTLGELLRADVAHAGATLVMSSPRRVTPYHIDDEVRFLLQLRGENIVNVFDPNDRTLLTESELEAFYTGDANAAKFKKERQHEARVFDFVPGTGLHLPVLAPCWTLNGDSISVAISLDFGLHSNARTAKVYRRKKNLRNRGIAPLLSAVSLWQDTRDAGAPAGNQ